MLINIAENIKLKSNNGEYRENKKELDLDKIKEYLINEKLYIIKTENKELLNSEIQKHLYDNYFIQDENIVKDTINKIIDKMFGYDILQKYIDDEKTTDIRVVSYNQIYTKSMGLWKKQIESFKDKDQYLEYVRYVILKNGGKINYETPIITISDKKYNLRIEAGIEPVNTMDPNLVIRIHRNNKKLTLEELCIRDNMFSLEVYTFLNKIMREQKNIVISGKGGSGKTTLLKCLIEKYPIETSITCNEETSELYLTGRNVIQREILSDRDKNNITLEMLMKQSLVMSNDVIIVGELKGSETMMFFDSIGTGHTGIATVHANNADSSLDRLVTLVKRDERASKYTEEFIMRMLADGIDYIIYMKNYKIEEILKIEYDYKKEKMKKKSIFKLKQINSKKYKNIFEYEVSKDE